MFAGGYRPGDPLAQTQSVEDIIAPPSEGSSLDETLSVSTRPSSSSKTPRPKGEGSAVRKTCNIKWCNSTEDLGERDKVIIVAPFLSPAMCHNQSNHLSTSVALQV